MLGGPDIGQPLAEELPYVILVCGGTAEDLVVSGPAIPFIPLGTIRGNVQIVAFLAPEYIAEQLVQHGVTAFQPAGPLHLGMQHNGTDPIGGETFRRFINPQVPKTEEGETGFVGLVTVPADIMKLAPGRTVVGSIEIAFPVQYFRGGE